MLGDALETKVNETRGYAVTHVYQITDLQLAMTSFEELYNLLLNPAVTHIPSSVWDFSELKELVRYRGKLVRPNAQCPVENELLRLLVLGLRRLSLRLKRIAVHVREVEQARDTEMELMTTFRGLLTRGKFNVLLIRGAAAMRDSARKQNTATEASSDEMREKKDKSKSDAEPSDPVLRLLKKVLHRLSPTASKKLEIYETNTLVDGYATFYVMNGVLTATEIWGIIFTNLYRIRRPGERVGSSYVPRICFAPKCQKDMMVLPNIG
ncbi:unnamed protein product [Echinostoma caproni]|uniref:SEC63 domain-containing protein n=1 Tax=Echinostoma caproni TaxID=27848 RepID=A0A183AI85_9TREM|nr:unnamed protein product [Echinostoma caproni]